MTNKTSGWTNFNNVGTDFQCFIFKPDAASVLSPGFHIPSPVNTKVTLNVYAYHTNATATYSPTVYVNASSNPVHEATGASASVSSSTLAMGGGKNPVDKDFAISMDVNKQKVSIYVYGKKNKGWLDGADYPEFFIKHCTISYQ